VLEQNRIPPPKGSKKEVLILRSNKSIVMPPANTGNLKTNKKAVTQTLIINNGILNHLNTAAFKLFMVHRKLMDPAIDLSPAKWRLKITISIELLECPKTLLRGG
jgi:hypothetical protein